MESGVTGYAISGEDAQCEGMNESRSGDVCHETVSEWLVERAAQQRGVTSQRA